MAGRLAQAMVGLYKLLYEDLGQLLLGAVGAEDIRAVGDKALADQGVFAHGAHKAVVMPVSVFEGDEASAADSGDWLDAGCAPLGE